MIEIRYPAVYWAEVPSKSTPIDGVATSAAPVLAPAWTDAGVHDPGVTLVQTFAWLGELEAFRLHPAGEAAAQRAQAMALGAGVAEGLAVGATGSPLKLSPGLALDPGGRVVGDDGADARRFRRPD